MRTKGFVTAITAAGLLLGAQAAARAERPQSTPAGSGGTFSVAIDEPDYLTPGRMGGAYEVIDALFSPLVAFGDDAELDYIGAESITTEDNITWTVSLQPGWTFHNGEPVTAESYAAAWNATAYGPNAWTNNGQLATIEGYSELNPSEGEPTADTLSGVEVIDDLTLRITLVGADSQFIYKLSQPGYFPMPSVAFDDLDAYDQAPIGNGPYMMAGEWEHDVQLTLTRYPDYQGDPPQVDNILFKIYSDQETAYTDALAGAVDIAGVPQSKYAQVTNDFGERFVAFNAVRLDWLGFPLWDERFDDIRIRQAVSMAIDRDAINEAIFAGLYTPATSFHGPTAIGGGTEGLCGEFCEFDPEAAQALLAEAGGWEGPFEIWFPGGVGYDQTFEAIANQIRQNLGIEEVVLESLPGFVPFLDALDQQTVTGSFRGGWGSLYPSMQNLLTAVFSSTGDGRAGAGGYTEPEVDTLIAEANAAPSEDAATELFQQAEARIMEDFPIVPLFYAKYVYAHSENVDNVTIGFGQIELADVTLAG